MIADLESEGREIDFEEFLDAITSRLGDKESRVTEYLKIERYRKNLRPLRRRQKRLY